MRFYFGRDGRYRGYSTSLGMWIAAAAVLGVFALAIGYQVLLLAPVIGLWALVIWLARPLFRRRDATAPSRSRRGSSSPRTGAGSPTDC